MGEDIIKQADQPTQFQNKIVCGNGSLVNKPIKTNRPIISAITSIKNQNILKTIFIWAGAFPYKYHCETAKE